MLQQDDISSYGNIGRESIDSMNSSTIYKSLSKYDPYCSEIYLKNVQNILKPQKKRKSQGKLAEELERAEFKQKKLIEALELIKKAKMIGKYGSLTIYFAAGVIFDEIDMYIEAIDAFKKSSRLIPAESIIDTYMMPNDDIHKRKIER